MLGFAILVFHEIRLTFFGTANDEDNASGMPARKSSGNAIRYENRRRGAKTKKSQASPGFLRTPQSGVEIT
jgi:hypothetical protein